MRSLTTFGGSDGEQRLGRLIPRPDIPVQPVLSWRTFLARGVQTASAVTDNGTVAFVTAARIAIAHALTLAGIQPGQKVLVPAYHCIVMVEPILHVGAEPVFYALREDLSVDLDDVAAKIDRETRAFIGVNYFGFPQPLDLLRRFCDQHRLSFIEDCAHSFFGSHLGRPLGTFGHFAVASLAKFFPVRDGGCLILGGNTHATGGIALRSQGLAANFAAALDTVEDAVALDRLSGVGPIVSLANAAKGLARAAVPKAGTAHGNNPALQRSGQRGGFDVAWMNVGATAVSRTISRRASRSRIIERRRRNYARLVEEFSGLRNCRPVFPQLPDGVVPYMFPLWIDHLSDVFPILEDRAVPMQRFGQFLWPDMDEGVCSVTRQHSRHSVQLACHQELTASEISEIVDRVRSVAA
jgi:dTDP-4-amino-4,6-dideoxygalactose transaminase